MRPLRLMLVRHGESVANAEGVMDTRPPGCSLTERGHQQATELAGHLAGDPVVAIYASKALRAQQTARPIANQHGQPVRTLEGVHEVFVGDLEGLGGPEAHRRLHEMYHAWYDGDLDRARPGGESGKRVVQRYLVDVATIRATHHAGTVVLVSHGAATRLAVVALASNVDAAFAKMRLLPNTGTVLLEADGAGWRCLRWDGIELGP